MDMKRTITTGKAIPVRGDDIDTDRIIPARYLRCVTFEGLGEHAFEDDRKALKEKGETHPFDDPRFSEATLLFANKNFGCGSSREHAPQAIMRWGKCIRAIVGESFSEIFFGNCVALGVPCVRVDEAGARRIMQESEADPETVFTLDLEKKELCWKNERVPVEIAEGPRQAFLDGSWDITGQLLEAKEQVAAVSQRLPYFTHWR